MFDKAHDHRFIRSHLRRRGRPLRAVGTYTVTLTVTDDKGATATSSQNVVIAGMAECTSSDSSQLDRNCRRSNVSATTGNYAYYYLSIPAGTTQLKITTSGGTGNADLYYSTGGWASTRSYLAKSAATGNEETLTITDPPTGLVYLSLHAQQGFSGVTIKAEY